VRILALAQVFPPKNGGSGRWLWELYRHLPAADVRVVAGAVDGDADFDRTAELPISRLPLDFASWGLGSVRSALEYARAFVRVRSFATRIGPDVIHCGKALPEGLIAAAVGAVRRTPFVVFVHGEEITLAAESRELNRLTRSVLKRASGIVANSESTKQLLVQSGIATPQRVVVIHPGVDTTRFTPAPSSAATRARLGWTDRRVVLTVGALQKRKGQDMLIRALPAIRARVTNVLYAIAGEGWERAYLENLAREHGVDDVVQFRGAPAFAELVECYQQCDLFALPNRQVGWDFEGFGIVLLEAQACGRPVIAGRSGGTAETMELGATGELVDCQTPDALAEAVIRLLETPDRLAAMGKRAREWTVARFDWAVLAREAEKRLESVVH
jgi:phosphatidylinositol alpha-1,6-mannosyltransferase